MLLLLRLFCVAPHESVKYIEFDDASGLYTRDRAYIVTVCCYFFPLHLLGSLSLSPAVEKLCYVLHYVALLHHFPQNSGCREWSKCLHVNSIQQEVLLKCLLSIFWKTIFDESSALRKPIFWRRVCMWVLCFMWLVFVWCDW